MEDLRIKLAVLWIVLEFGLIMLFVMENIIPGFVVEHYAQTTPLVIVIIVILGLISPVMAFLSLTLKYSINRWANIILGIVFAGLGLTIPIGYPPTAHFAFAIPVTILEFIAAALIAWYAWKWPKLEA